MSASSRWFLSCGAAALAFASLALPAAAKLDLSRYTPVPDSEPIPAMDFFREPAMKTPSLNLSGTHVAALASGNQDRTDLLVYELRTKKIGSFALTAGDTDIVWVDWLDARKLIFGVGVWKMGSNAICAADADRLGDAYALIQFTGGYFVSVPPKDRLHPLVALSPHGLATGEYGQVVSLNASYDNGKLYDLTGAHGDSGKGYTEARESTLRHFSRRYPVLETPKGFGAGYYADREGELAFAISSTDGVRTLHRLEGERWLDCPMDLDQLEFFGSGDHPGDITVLGPRRDGKPRALEFMKAETGQAGEVLLEDSAYDFDGYLFRDPTSQAIVGAMFNRAAPQSVWFTEGYRQVQAAVDKLFPGMIVRILGVDEGGKTVLLGVWSDRQPVVYRWVDLATHQVADIQASRPWIDPKRMQPMNVIKYKTRDGRKIDAYLTMPAGASKQNPPPLVVLPSGWGNRHTWGYDDEVQFFASRGYAVLEPNHRGSDGYSWMFTEEDEWDYRKMVEDVIDATRYVTKSGLIDAKRVAIIGSSGAVSADAKQGLSLGTSFRGYLALAAAAFEPDLYQCAIAMSPTCDWGHLVQDQKYFQFRGGWYDRIRRKLGDPKKNPAKFSAMSALDHADQIRAAVLVSTSEYDLSSDTADAKELVSKVRAHGIPAETISFTNEAEGVWHLDHKVELYTKIESFLAEHLGGAKSK